MNSLETSCFWTGMEEAGSHHCILKTKKELNKLKNQQLLLYLSEKWCYRANYCPAKWREQANKENCNLLKQKLISTDHYRKQYWGREILTMMNFWRISMNKPNKYKPQGNQLWRTPTLLRISAPVLPAGRGGKGPFWNMAEHSVLLNKACPQEKILNQSLASRGFIRTSSKGVGNTKF